MAKPTCCVPCISNAKEHFDCAKYKIENNNGESRNA